MDKCPRSNPLLLSFKFLVQDSSASRPGRHFTILRMHWPNIRMAFRDLPSNDSNSKQFLQHGMLHEADLCVPWRENTQVCEVRVTNKSGHGDGLHLQCSSSCSPSSNVFASLQSRLQPFDLLLEDDRGVRICHRFPRDVYSIVYLHQEMN